MKKPNSVLAWCPKLSFIRLCFLWLIRGKKPMTFKGMKELYGLQKELDTIRNMRLENQEFFRITEQRPRGKGR